MICSECSAVVRPIVAIDIDGTLGKYHEHFWQFASQYFDVRLKNSFSGSGPFNEALGLSKEDYREAKLAYRQGGGKRTMPMFDDVGVLTKELSRLDCEVWLTTTRPYMRHDSTDPDTRFWLERHGIPYDHLLYDDHKYAKLADIVDKRRVVMIIDDLAEQINEARSHFGPLVPVLVSRKSNESVQITGIDKMSMESVAKQCAIRVHRWHLNHRTEDQ